MKSIIYNLNKAFDNRIRLGIMSILMLETWVDFAELKELLELTDGNLANHISTLEKEQYIVVRKAFIGKKTSTSFQATEAGREAFQEHLKVMESLIKGNK